MAYESNQQETVIKMLNEYSKFAELSKLPANRKELMYYLAGFTDAEGCFSVALKHQEGTRFGWVLDPVFHVTQHSAHQGILEIFERVLGCGRIFPKPGQPETLQFYVDNRRQLKEKIIPFFSKYRLICKDSDFQKFARIVEGLENKEHSRKDLFVKLVKLAFTMNLDGKQRRYSLDEILKSISDTGSSETIRQTPEQG